MLGLSDQTGSVPVREVGGLVSGWPRRVEAALRLIPAIPRRVSVADNSWCLWHRDPSPISVIWFVSLCTLNNLIHIEPTLWMQAFISSSKVQSSLTALDSIFIYLFSLFPKLTVFYRFTPVTLATRGEPISLGKLPSCRGTLLALS